METDFENKTTFTADILYEYIANSLSGKLFKLATIIMAIGFFIYAIVGYLIKSIPTLLVNLLLFLLTALYLKKVFISLTAKLLLRKRFWVKGEAISKITKFKDKVYITTLNDERTSCYEYKYVKEIHETEHLIILRVQNVRMLLDKRNFTIGEIENFEKFISLQCPSARFIHR